MPSFRGSSQPRDRIPVSRIAGDSLPSDPPKKPRNGYRCGHLLPAPRPPTHCHEPQVPPEFQNTKFTPCASKAGLRVSGAQAECINSWRAYLLCHSEGLFFFLFNVGLSIYNLSRCRADIQYIPALAGEGRYKQLPRGWAVSQAPKSPDSTPSPLLTSPSSSPV